MTLRKHTEKLYSFLVINAMLASDNHSGFRKNFLEKKIQKLIMTIDDKIKDENLQYDINTEAAKISALSFGKIDKFSFFFIKSLKPYIKRNT